MPAFAGMTAECSRASSPRVHSGPRVRRSFLSLISPEGACGTLGRFTAPAAPRASCDAHGTLRREAQGSRVPWPHTACVSLRSTRSRESENAKGSRDGHRSRYFACVPHAMDLSACCMSPGIVAFADTPPGSDGLPPGHALGPSTRPRFALQAPRRACAPAFVALVPRLPDVPSVIRVLSGPAS